MKRYTDFTLSVLPWPRKYLALKNDLSLGKGVPPKTPFLGTGGVRMRMGRRIKLGEDTSPSRSSLSLVKVARTELWPLLPDRQKVTGGRSSKGWLGGSMYVSWRVVFVAPHSQQCTSLTWAPGHLGTERRVSAFCEYREIRTRRHLQEPEPPRAFLVKNRTVGWEEFQGKQMTGTIADEWEYTFVVTWVIHD